MSTNAADPLETGSGKRPLTAVITGAASGIGAAVAMRLAESGVAVVLVDLGDLTAAAAAATRLGAPAVETVQGDIADPSTLADAASRAAGLGSLRYAVFCAGLMTGQADVATLSDKRYRAVIDANVHGVFNGIRAFLRTVGSSGGHIVVVASGGGLLPVPHDPVYALTKHAVIGLVRSLAAQPDLSHVEINCICPGAVDTPMLSQESKEGRALLTPRDVADKILWILDSHTTGQAWVCTPTVLEPFDFPPNPGYEFPSSPRQMTR